MKMGAYRNIAGAVGVGLLSASLVSCGHKLMNLGPGEHYAALTSCDVTDEPQGRRILCRYGDGSDTVTVNGELTSFTLVKGGRIEYFIGAPLKKINDEDAKLAREAKRRHRAAVEFLYNNEKKGKK